VTPPRIIAAITVVHFDDALLVADKPTGLLTEPGRGEHLRDSLIVRLQERWPDLRIVHRLDRDTSGLIVVPRTAEAHRDLSRQFHDRLIDKQYTAVVAGVMAEDAGRIDLPLRKDLENPPRHRVDHELGKPAVTDYRVIARHADRTRVALHPLTGRSHQLRIHLRALGHAILGDPLYGDVTSAPRLLLHATQITFTHPTTGEPTTFHSEPPF
jgi:tRNA pseudouridine32 synthase/23S rRNA pseudouridine746 synthase